MDVRRYQEPVSGYNPAQYGQQAQYSQYGGDPYGKGGSGPGAPAYGGYQNYGQAAQSYGPAGGYQGAYRSGPY